LGTKITIEIFSSSFCSRCQKSKNDIKEIIASVEQKEIEYKEIDVVEQLDYSVSMGVLTTPSIAINGKLLFTSTPSRSELEKQINRLLD